MFTRVLWEADTQSTVDDLLFKKILLVEEKNDGSICEPLIVTDTIKQLHTFMHPILSR